MFSIKIHVRTTIMQGNEKETYELTTFGRLQEKGQAHYLLYEEFLEEGKIKTSLKFSKEEAVILRSGAINMRLAFKTGYVRRGHYESVYGALEALTDTKEINHQIISNGEGKLDLRYDLTMQGEAAGTYHMEIHYKEE